MKAISKERVRALLLAIDDVQEGRSTFGTGNERAWFVDGREIAHFDADGSLDLRLTRAEISAQRARLKALPQVTLRRSGGDWINIKPSGADDLSLLQDLCERAVRQHRPKGRTPKPPPEGPELARRRRFH